MADHDARDMASLKLTSDQQGVVWKLAGSYLPRTTGLTIHEFVSQHNFDAEDQVRIVGTVGNAPLIVGLYHRRLKSDFASLEVCSPLCCVDPNDRNDSEVVLYSMRKFRRPPSLGGWHEFVVKDYPSYILATYFADLAVSMRLETTTSGINYPADYPKKLIMHHPAWPYLSFIDGLDSDACAELLASLLDPRWYTDPSPDGADGDRMEHYLGLYPGISKEKTSARAKRYQLALGCWKNSGGSALKADGPRGFIWRTWAAKGGGERGDIAACKCFVTYLRITWTMSMCSGPQARHLFVPNYFFSNKDELNAYAKHINSFSPQP